jgi:hypothetical protein
MAVALVALVLAATGTAVATSGLVRGDKIIKVGSLSGNRLRKHTLTGDQINLAKLGKVPSAVSADTAGAAGTANTANTANSANTAKTATSATTASSAATATLASSASTAGDVGGYAANMLSRVGLDSHESLFGINSETTSATVSISAPAAGFVKLEATFTAEDVFAATLCTSCTLEARLHDVSAGVDSPMIVAEATGGTKHYIPGSLAYVFPATKGAHSYSLTSAEVATGGPLSIDNPVLIAQFVPFGSSGSATTLVATGTAMGTGTKHPSPTDGRIVRRGP